MEQLALDLVLGQRHIVTNKVMHELVRADDMHGRLPAA